AVHLIEDVDRPVALPRELDSHRLTLLRDPDSVDAPEGAHVALACHGNSERFLLVRQHNRFQDCSVCVGDRHASILRLPASANKSLQVQCFRPVGTGPVLTMVMEPATAGTAEADFAPGSALLLETPAAMIALEISSRNAHVQALQKRWDRLRAGLDLVLDQRGRTRPICPAAPAGCWCATARVRKPTSSSRGCGLRKGPRATGSTLRRHDRPRDQQPQRMRHGAPKALG